MRFNLKRMIFRSAEKTHFFSVCRLKAVLMLGRNMPENEAWTSFSGSFFILFEVLPFAKNGCQNGM